MISIYQLPKYLQSIAHAAAWELTNKEYYSSMLCLKSVGGLGKDKTVSEAHSQMSDLIADSLKDIEDKKQAFQCVLPKGHTGKCDKNIHKKLFKHPTLECKLDWIYTTPGDDDYIYKNRASRLFPIAVDDSHQRQWRNKDVKRKCAIPLREASTPFMMASGFLDYLTLIMNIEGIQEHFADCEHKDQIIEMVSAHKVELQTYYSSIGRKIFDAEGYSICPVILKRIALKDILDSDICNENAIQLGHVVPRSEDEFTIRGKNILMMTRQGNRLVGNHKFSENVWLDNLRELVIAHSL